jgi:hypothetical protein
MGDVIEGTGGLRKARWSVPGRGKSGWCTGDLLSRRGERPGRLLLIYRKGVKDDLTPTEKKILRKLNQDWQK